ncbi:MAG: AAA family ATPase [Chthoniobacterales bacterium]
MKTIPDSLSKKLVGLEPHLSAKIIGQDHVIPRVCSVLERALLDLTPDDKPLGSLLFLGPTGVGKTQLTLEFAKFLFGDDALFRFDMSEFQHIDSVKLFMGDEGGREGRLGQILAGHSRGVLLFDEIEKANRLIWDLFLQMTDAARITLADHRTYYLSGFVLVFTSNIGAQSLLRPTRLPFTTLERAVLAELHRVFRPEFIGRFDEKIVFKPLAQETQRRIAQVGITDELDRLASKGHHLTVESEVIEFLIRRGIHKTLGARPLQQVVRKHLGDVVRDAVKLNQPSSGRIRVSANFERLVFVV